MLTGLATLVLAIAAIVQGRHTRQQIALGNRQAELAEKQAKSAQGSAETAVQVYRESIRTRVDQDAPRVVASFEPPYPPLIDAQRRGMPQANELRLLASESLDRADSALGHEFVFDQDRELFLWFHGRGLLVNEGAATARVRLSGEGRFTAGRTPLADGEIIELPAMEASSHPFAILPPGGRALFEWAGGHTVGKWADASEHSITPSPHGSIWSWIEIFDPREIGVIDTLMVHFRPEVVHRVRGREGHWRVDPSAEFGPVHPLPTRRNYKHEGAVGADVSQMHDYHKPIAEKHSVKADENQT